MSLKNKNQLCFGKISFRNVTMKRRLLSCTWHFWRGLKWVFETKLREFSIILETFFQKSNTWITFENLIFLNFIWKKKDFYHNFGWKESWRKLMVSFENLILKRWHDRLFQDFFVESFLFWPWLFNFLRNDLTSRFLIFFSTKNIFFMKKFSFLKKKKRKKF